MSFNREQFKNLIENVLNKIALCSPSAVNMLLGTAAQESQFGTYLRQLDNGPALGVFQMEPDTEKDIWDNYLNYRPMDRLSIFSLTSITEPDPFFLECNLAYQIAMARIHYYRVDEPLPEADDLPGLARYYKLYYNTPKGKATEEEFIRNYKKYIMD